MMFGKSPAAAPSFRAGTVSNTALEIP